MSYRPALLMAALCLASSATLAHTNDKFPADSGPSGHSALRAACPQVDETLQTLLQGTAWRLIEDTRLRVQFRLEGERISEIRAQGGSQRLHERVRRAVEKLPCHSVGGVAQELSFSLALQRR